MNPIPKPPRHDKTPVQKAIDEILRQWPRPKGVIVHPSLSDKDIADLKAAIESASKPVIAPPPSGVTGGPLTKAWEDWMKTPPSQQNVTLVPHQVQAAVSATALEQQLEDSLWAMARLHAPIYTREALYTHVGPGHMEDDWYIKRLNGTEEVFLLCKCQTILVLSRCAYFFDGFEADVSGNKPRSGDRCEEPAFVKEAQYRRDVRCGFHKDRRGKRD